MFIFIFSMMATMASFNTNPMPSKDSALQMLLSHTFTWTSDTARFGSEQKAPPAAYTVQLSLRSLRLFVTAAPWVKPRPDWARVLGVTRGRNVCVLRSLWGRHLLVLANLRLALWGGRGSAGGGMGWGKGMAMAMGYDNGDIFFGGEENKWAG